MKWGRKRDEKGFCDIFGRTFLQELIIQVDCRFLDEELKTYQEALEGIREELEGVRVAKGLFDDDEERQKCLEVAGRMSKATIEPKKVARKTTKKPSPLRFGRV